MAVSASPLTSALIVIYQSGTSPLGAPIKRQKSLNGVRFDASEEALYKAAQTLFGLSKYPVIDVLNRKTFKLIDE